MLPSTDGRLEAIAGPPLAHLNVPNSSSEPVALAATDARTIYAVASKPVAATVGDQVVASLGTVSTSSSGREGAMVLRTNSVSLGGFTNRIQLLGGTAAFAFVSFAATDRKFVFVAWWDGAQSTGITVDGPTNTQTLTGSGMVTSDVRLRLGPVSASAIPVATVAYRGMHTPTVRLAVMRWLAHRYGTTPPTV